MKNIDPIAVLRRMLNGKTQKALAGELGISPPYLGDVLAGHRRPGKSILLALGLQRQIVYVQTKAKETA